MINAFISKIFITLETTNCWTFISQGHSRHIVFTVETSNYNCQSRYWIEDLNFDRSELRISFLTNQNWGFHFWPIRIEDFNFDQSESRISIFTNQNWGFQFWPIRIENFNFDQSESRISILTNLIVIFEPYIYFLSAIYYFIT